MANSYVQNFLHCVWAVKHRNAMISSEVREPLYRFITGIVQAEGHTLLRIGGVQDQVHLLIALSPRQALADLMRVTKSKSSAWLNESKKLKFHFYWQDGYSAFSVSVDRLETVKRYIMNQEEHHKKHSFLDEYRLMLERQGIQFQNDFIFTEPE